MPAFHLMSLLHGPQFAEMRLGKMFGEFWENGVWGVTGGPSGFTAAVGWKYTALSDLIKEIMILNHVTEYQTQGALGLGDCRLYECCCGTYLWFSSVLQGTPESEPSKPSDIRLDKWQCVKQNKNVDIWTRYALTISKCINSKDLCTTGGPYGSAYFESAWTVIFNKYAKIYSSQVIYKHLCLFCSLRC